MTRIDSPNVSSRLAFKWLFLCSIGLLMLSIFASLLFGSKEVAIKVVLQALFNTDSTNLEHIIVLERLPRTVFGVLAGSALSVSGAMMQAITRNPIADPGILGVNTGAALGVVIGIFIWHIESYYAYIVCAMVGASATVVFVYRVGSIGSEGATPIKLALAGAVTSAALSSIISALVLPNTQVMNLFRFWQIGTISGATWEGIRIVLPVLAVGFLICIMVAPTLDLLSLGDDLAKGLGIHPNILRLVGSVGGIMLCAATTALAGPIGFIGLMVPHLVRQTVGMKMKLVIPLSALGGAVILLLADTIGRILGRPGELEAGIITALIGAPILIFIARRTQVNAL